MQIHKFLMREKNPDIDTEEAEEETFDKLY